MFNIPMMMPNFCSMAPLPASLPPAQPPMAAAPQPPIARPLPPLVLASNPINEMIFNRSNNTVNEANMRQVLDLLASLNADGGAPTPDTPAEREALCNVYVASLPLDLDDTYLYNMFRPFGEIHSARIMRSKGFHQSKGYGFVLYQRPESALLAITTLQGSSIGSHYLQVRMANVDASLAYNHNTLQMNLQAALLSAAPALKPTASANSSSTSGKRLEAVDGSTSSSIGGHTVQEGSPYSTSPVAAASLGARATPTSAAPGSPYLPRTTVVTNDEYARQQQRLQPQPPALPPPQPMLMPPQSHGHSAAPPVMWAPMYQPAPTSMAPAIPYAPMAMPNMPSMPMYYMMVPPS